MLKLSVILLPLQYSGTYHGVSSPGVSTFHLIRLVAEDYRQLVIG